MITVQFPEPDFRIQNRAGRRFIFDAIRKTWLLLTEEEWVRQNMVAYLVKSKQYPAAFINLEKEILVNGLTKRFDIVVYNGHHQPWMLVECKAPDVKLGEDVLQQVLRYNLALPVPFLVITNGRQTLLWEKQAAGLQQRSQLPDWNATGH
ncbi:MAG TPA: type I restriction enzyme HsdR N-terminal domain-containing protein [Flavisolibacter sp.]|nr:type I restriction enzyme HsdR N-terminal domain-containing protein [Flavisolibacter sp.]